MFKVKDKVRVKKGLEVGKKYGECIFNRYMACYGGRTAVVSYVLPNDSMQLKWSDTGRVPCWLFSPEMLELVEEKKTDSEEKTITITREQFKETLRQTFPKISRVTVRKAVEAFFGEEEGEE